MKKNFLVLLAFMLAGTQFIHAQHFRTSYFMENSTVRMNLNPAFRTDRGYIDVPGIGALGIGFASNSFALDDIFYPDGNGGMISVLNRKITFDSLTDKLAGNNRVAFDTQISVLGAGIRTGRGFWDFGLDIRTEGGVSVPDDMLRFLKRGSGTYDLSGFSYGLDSYSVLSAGYSYRINRELVIGARLNLMGGIARMRMRFDKLDLTLNGSQWSADAKGVLEIASRNAADYMTGGTVDMEDVEFKLNGLSGSGFSVDLGLHYRFMETLDLSLSLLDLGFIRWGGNHSVVSSYEGGFSFTGIEITGKDMVIGYTGDVDDLMNFEEGEKKGVTSGLKGKLVMGAELPLLDHYLTVGVVFMTKRSQFISRSEFSAALTIRPVHWFTAAISYSFDKSENIGREKWNSIGLALNFHPSWINFYIGTDYMVSRLSTWGIPLGQKVFNVCVGLSVPIGRMNGYTERYL